MTDPDVETLWKAAKVWGGILGTLLTIVGGGLAWGLANVASSQRVDRLEAEIRHTELDVQEIGREQSRVSEAVFRIDESLKVINEKLDRLPRAESHP